MKIIKFALALLLVTGLCLGQYITSPVSLRYYIESTEFAKFHTDSLTVDEYVDWEGLRGMSSDRPFLYFDGYNDSMLVAAGTLEKKIYGLSMLVYLPSVTDVTLVGFGNDTLAITAGVVSMSNMDTIWVNGKNTTTVATGWNHLALTDATEYTATKIVIATSTTGTSYSRFSISNFRTWNRTLTVADMKEIGMNAPVVFRYDQANNDIMANYDTSGTQDTDIAGLVRGRNYRWIKGNADSLMITSTKYTASTSFVYDGETLRVNGGGAGDLTGSNLYPEGNVLKFEPDGIVSGTWVDAGSKEKHSTIVGATLASRKAALLVGDVDDLTEIRTVSNLPQIRGVGGANNTDALKILTDDGNILIIPADYLNLAGSGDATDYVRLTSDGDVVAISNIGGADASQHFKIITDDGHLLIQPADDLYLNPVGDDIISTDATTLKPEFLLENTNTDEFAAIIRFNKNGENEADDDLIGSVVFDGEDSGNANSTFVWVEASSQDITATDEAGGLDVYLEMDDTKRNYISLNAFGQGVVDDGTIEFNADQQDVDFEINTAGESSFILTGSDGTALFANTVTSGNDGLNQSGSYLLIASDGDASNVTIDTNDDMLFQNATDYVFDSDIEVDQITDVGGDGALTILTGGTIQLRPSGDADDGVNVSVSANIATLAGTGEEDLILGSASNEINAIYMGDDLGLYFGLGQDFSVEYDEDGNDHMIFDGTDINYSGYYSLNEQGSINLRANAMPSPYLRFDGVNDVVTVTDHADLDFGTGDGAIKFKIYMPDVSGSVTWLSRYTNDNNRLLAYYDQGLDKIIFLFKVGGTTMHEARTAAWSPSANTWYNVTWAFINGTSQAVYVNGIPQTLTTDINTGGAMNLAADITFGLQNIAYGEIQFSDYQQFNLNLTAAEVKKYQNGSVDFLHQDASNTEFFTTATDRTFTGAGDTNWENVDFGTTFNEEDDLTILATAIGQYGKITFANIGTNLEIKKRYRLVYDYSETTAGFEFKLGGATGQTLGDAVAGTGQTIEFTAVEDYATTDFLGIYAKTAAAAAGDFDNFSIIQIGLIDIWDQTGMTASIWYGKQGHDGTITGATLHNAAPSLLVRNNDADAVAAPFVSEKTRSGGVITTADVVGSWIGKAHDGTDLHTGVGKIDFVSSGTIAGNRTPGGIDFYYATDVATSLLTEGLELNNAGSLILKKAAADATFIIDEYHDTEATTPLLVMRKAEGTLDTPTADPLDDLAVLGTISFRGYENSSYLEGAMIRGIVSGTPANDQMPTDLEFWTNTGGTNATRRGMFHESGEFLVGDVDDPLGRFGQNFESHIAANAGGGLFATWSTGNTQASLLDLYKNAGATIGTHAVVEDNELLGIISGGGSDGVEFLNAAQILFVVDGTLTGGGTDDMPGSIEFRTTPDGSATPAFALTLDATQYVILEATKRLYFDGASGVESDTYLAETAADVFNIFVGGVDALEIKEGTNIIVGIQNSALETWDVDYSALQVGGSGSLSALTTQAAGAEVWLASNAYYDETNTRWEYMSTGADDEASLIEMKDGAIVFKVTSTAGADDAVITWTNVTIAKDGDITGADAAAWALQNEASSATNPTLIPDKTELGTGIGGTTDYLSLIASSKEGIRVVENTPSTSSITYTDIFAQSYGDNDAANGDYMFKVSGTLNDTQGGTAEIFRAVEVDVTTTSTAGWGGTVYLMDLQDDNTTMFNVDIAGNVNMVGALGLSTLDLTPASNIDAIDVTGTNMTTASVLDADLGAMISGQVIDIDLSTSTINADADIIRITDSRHHDDGATDAYRGVTVEMSGNWPGASASTTYLINAEYSGTINNSAILYGVRSDISGTLTGGTYAAGYFTDGTRIVALADGTNAITATGDISLDGDLDFVGAQEISTGGNALLTITGGTAGVRLDDFIGIDTAPDDAFAIFVSSTITGVASNHQIGINNNPTITGVANATLLASYINPTLTEANSGTHPTIAGISINNFTVTDGGGAEAVTNLAGLYIAGAPVAGTAPTNGPYSIFVDAGPSRFDGDIGDATNRVPEIFATDIDVANDLWLATGSMLGIEGEEIITFTAGAPGTINITGASFDVDGNATASTYVSDGLITATGTLKSVITTGGVIEVDRNENDINDGEILGGVHAYGLDAARAEGARISFEAAGTWDTGTDVDKAATEIHFYTEDGTTTDAMANPRLIIENDGDFVLFSAETGQDYTLTRDGETNDLIETWLEDENTLELAITSTATNAVTNILRLEHVGGVPVAGFGAGIEFNLEENDATERIAAIIEVLWTDAGETTNADADMVFKLMLNDGAAAEKMRITSAGVLHLGGAQIDSDDLSDVASIGMLDEAETVTADWTFSSATTLKPLITIKNTTDDGTAGTLEFVSDRATPTDNDVAGNIVFEASDGGGTQTDIASIIVSMPEVDDAEEIGKFVLNVFDESDGSGALQNVLAISGGNSAGAVQALYEINADQKDIDWELNMNAASAMTMTASSGAVDVVNAFTANTVASDGAISGTAITGTSFIIGGNTLTTTEWGYLDDQNQAVTTTGTPTFNEYGNTTLQQITLPGAAVTFAVTSNVVEVTGDGGGNTIATITGALIGLYTFIFTDAQVTISNDDGHAANTVDLDGANDYTGADDYTLLLVFNGTSWYKVSNENN